ncbi:hypothetical protein TrLO_g10605 [Triparma laevis f. longispina]|uniref:Methyltransferase domain-containing protein n=1 Tax=Triparma laevis f. longispina TaxID=1714387 RepID=A0A9W7AIL2_9STRA|nr:hypothetical protein TrLO_g10605 [Triparma laevis f. longispina]
MLAPRKTLWSTPPEVTALTSSLLSPTSTDKIYDVGCGDARVLISLAKSSDCNELVGIEIDETRAIEARENVKREGFESRIEIKNENAMYIDYSSATIIFLYLVPRGLRLIKPLILPPSSPSLIPLILRKSRSLKIVTYMSPMPGEKFKVKKLVEVEHQKGSGWPVFYYELRRVGGRNEDGFDAKTRLEQQRHEQLAVAADHESYELTAAGMRDADNYKKFLAKQEQLDYAKRNEDGFDAKTRLEQQRHEQLAADHESYELTAAGMRDADAYRKQMAEEERQDYENRNLEGSAQKRLLEEQRTDQLHSEHESFELKWAGQDDAKAYQQHLRDERRKSFAARNENHSQQRKIVQEIEEIAKEKEHESMLLKWAAQEDGKAYRKRCEEERRMSLVGRGEQARHEKLIDEENKMNALNQQHYDSELASAAARDVKGYKESCAARDRASLCFRAKESRIQRMEEESRIAQQREIDQENNALEAAAREDVKAYVKQCKARRRMSLATRAQEKRNAAEVARFAAEEEQARFKKEVRNRQLDAKYAALAKERENAMRALENLKHKGCTLAAMNPFAMLLD